MHVDLPLVKVRQVDLIHLHPYNLGVRPWTDRHFLKGWMGNSGELFEICRPACVLFLDWWEFVSILQIDT